VLAERVLAWRKSPEGQQAYERQKSINDGKRTLLGFSLFFGGAFVGFIFGGFIGLFFDAGLLFGLIGAGVGCFIYMLIFMQADK
jgi:hypothetical protein